MSKTRMAALLRGINVGGHRRVPMAELRAVAEGIGLKDVATYIQSGNLVFTSAKSPRSVLEALEAAIRAHFGFAVDVAVRTRDAWRAAESGCPFLDAAEQRPNLLHLCLPRDEPRVDGLEKLSSLCRGGERVALVGGELWIDYAGGAGRSKLSPVALDKAMGCPVTARNWKTVRQLLEMLG